MGGLCQVQRAPPAIAQCPGTLPAAVQYLDSPARSPVGGSPRRAVALSSAPDLRRGRQCLSRCLACAWWQTSQCRSSYVMPLDGLRLAEFCSLSDGVSQGDYPPGFFHMEMF